LRLAYQFLGLLAVALAVLGVALPLLPTVPFLLLAIFFFARSNPEWERRIIEHPRFGPPVRAWRERGAIGTRAKLAAATALTASALAGLVFLEWPLSVVPLIVALLSGAWILSRPSE
jgi:uncharacterized membrane protein YbaN (DUF454 family)